MSVPTYVRCDLCGHVARFESFLMPPGWLSLVLFGEPKEMVERSPLGFPTHPKQEETTWAFCRTECATQAIDLIGMG